MINPNRKPIRRKKSYDQWANAMSRKWGISRDEFNAHPYDYAQYYKDNYDEAWEHVNNKLAPYQHFPDRYKTAQHPTFSDESDYSDKFGIYNPSGIRGGHWADDDKYVFDKDQINYKWPIDKTAEYVSQENVKLYTPHGKQIQPKYSGGKDDDPHDDIWFNGNRYTYDQNTQRYVNGGNQPVQFAQGGMLPEVTVAPSTRQRLDHPLLFNQLNLARMTPEQKEIYYKAKQGLGSEKLAEFMGELTPVGDATDAYRIGGYLSNGNLGAAAAGVGLFFLPNIIEKPLRRLVRNYKRYRHRAELLNSIDDHKLADEIALSEVDRAAEKGLVKVRVVPSSEANKLYEEYKYGLDVANEIESFIKGGRLKEFGYSKEDKKRLAQIFRENPEYYIHVRQNQIKDPLSDHAIDGFVRRQTTVRRGVYAPDRHTAERYLTETDPTRWLTGGDRLNTNGGVYTSNNPIISNRFKNPTEGTANGYDAILREKYTDEIYDTPENRLKRLRDRIENFDDPILDFMQHSMYYHDFEDFTDTLKPIARESKYVGSANRGTGGYERAYLPNSDGRTKERPLYVEEVKEYKDQTNRRGRWARDKKSRIV